MTIRQRIIKELHGLSMTARELSKTLRISEKDVFSHLKHVALSLKAPNRLSIEPAECNSCGFTFSDRRRYTTPSRCPRCRHEGIRPAAFGIEP